MSRTAKRLLIALADHVVWFADMVVWPLAYAALGVLALVMAAWFLKEVLG